MDIPTARLGFFKLNVPDLDQATAFWREAFGFTVYAMRPRLLRSLNELVTIDHLGGDRCRVTYRQAFDPRPWSAWLVRLLARWIMPKALTVGLSGLDRVSRR